MMKVDVSSEIVIRRPRREVAEYSSNPDNAPSWYVNIKFIEWKTPPLVQVGSQIPFVAHFFWRRMAYIYEVVELVPSERLVMRTADGPFPMETTYAWETDADDGTRMTLRNRGTPTGFSKLVVPFLARAVQSANRKDLGALKKLLETRGDVSLSGVRRSRLAPPLAEADRGVARAACSVLEGHLRHVRRQQEQDTCHASATTLNGHVDERLRANLHGVGHREE